MQVIFNQNISGVARKGQIKEVSDGYYHNFLLPKKLAEIATPAKIKAAQAENEKMTIEKDRIREEAQLVKSKLEGLTITINAKANGDKLYGSITEREILDAIKAKANVSLGRDHLHLKEHFKTTGKFPIQIKLSETVNATLTLEIKALT